MTRDSGKSFVMSALDGLGVDAADVVAIEDSVLELEGARDAMLGRGRGYVPDSDQNIQRTRISFRATTEGISMMMGQQFGYEAWAVWAQLDEETGNLICKAQKALICGLRGVLPGRIWFGSRRDGTDHRVDKSKSNESKVTARQYRPSRQLEAEVQGEVHRRVVGGGEDKG
ncbi:hypothetical protein P692DRAFT_201809956 [Suillus brevipes Sb2]|nr:hypothetical protein P692DRAFT_201809956 [Suillus brevipes Sb2]